MVADENIEQLPFMNPIVLPDPEDYVGLYPTENGEEGAVIYGDHAERRMGRRVLYGDTREDYMDMLDVVLDGIERDVYPYLNVIISDREFSKNADQKESTEAIACAFPDLPLACFFYNMNSLKPDSECGEEDEEEEEDVYHQNERALYKGSVFLSKKHPLLDKQYIDALTQRILRINFVRDVRYVTHEDENYYEVRVLLNLIDIDGTPVDPLTSLYDISFACFPPETKPCVICLTGKKGYMSASFKDSKHQYVPTHIWCCLQTAYGKEKNTQSVHHLSECLQQVSRICSIDKLPFPRRVYSTEKSLLKIKDAVFLSYHIKFLLDVWRRSGHWNAFLSIYDFIQNISEWDELPPPLPNTPNCTTLNIESYDFAFVKKRVLDILQLKPVCKPRINAPCRKAMTLAMGREFKARKKRKDTKSKSAQ
eukprot:Nk52_evm15s251 gene=Nk52_evmTU15s251